MRDYNTIPSAKIDCICQQCGTPFVTFRSNIARGNGRFCSFDCGVAHREIPLETRFWKKVDKTDDCWLWTGQLSPLGYGKFAIKENGKWRPAQAHRIAYELEYGPIPDNLFACHRCDNPTCVRHDHLFLGTNDDNVQDKVNKGRQMKGEQAHASKMTDDLVTEIRQRYAKGDITKTELAQEYGMGKPAMGDILNGITWKHIPTIPRADVKRAPGRTPRGERLPMAKLTDSKVIEIRQRYKKRVITQRQLAEEYGVSESVISEVVNRVIWTHIP